MEKRIEDENKLENAKNFIQSSIDILHDLARDEDTKFSSEEVGCIEDAITGLQDIQHMVLP